MEKDRIAQRASHDISNYYSISEETLRFDLATVKQNLASLFPDQKDFVITGRVKDLKSCLEKISRKCTDPSDYLDRLVSGEKIEDVITDLIACRVICPYADQVDLIAERIRSKCQVHETVDKRVELDEKEDVFGYKALHLVVGGESIDLGHLSSRRKIEIQVRTYLQDIWSVVDWKLKYKRNCQSILNGA